ncbi:Metallo-dependent phosphatase-like protein [Globomyces pollinis-pini]|nr:Metallo-dependent phosphatase-like protein [Globomyces pollinis-pini]
MLFSLAILSLAIAAPTDKCVVVPSYTGSSPVTSGSSTNAGTSGAAGAGAGASGSSGSTGASGSAGTSGSSGVASPSNGNYGYPHYGPPVSGNHGYDVKPLPGGYGKPKATTTAGIPATGTATVSATGTAVASTTTSASAATSTPTGATFGAAGPYLSPGQTIVFNKNAPKKINLIHTNDMHSYLDEFNLLGNPCTEADQKKKECVGGAARLSTTIKKLRSEYENTILLDAGDMFTGTLLFTYYGGEAIGYFMNKMKYDTACVGNHDFDKGINYLGQYTKNLTFPLLSSNIDYTSNRTTPISSNIKPYIVFPKYNLGVIGYITKDMATLVNDADVKALPWVDPAVTTQKYVDELRSKGINRIIAVSHNGYAEDQDLAKRTKGIDLIVGGHSHTLLSNDPKVIAAGKYPTRVKNLEGDDTIVVQARCYADYLGNLEIEFDDKDNIVKVGGDPIFMANEIEKDPEIDSQIQVWNKQFAELLEVIAYIPGFDSSKACRTQECVMGNLLNDCFMQETATWNPKPDGAFTNAGGIRARFSEYISSANVLQTLPFGNLLVPVQLTGEEIINQFEKAMAGTTIINGASVKVGFPQWSKNIKAVLDKTKPVNSRVVSIELNGAPVDPKKTYTLITNDFVAGGGDALMPGIKGKLTGPVMADVLIQCLKRTKGEGLPAKEDGRITIKQ